MRRAATHAEVLSEHISFAGKTAVDVGCGTGDLIRWMASQGATAVGIDTPQMIARAENNPEAGGERYVVGDALSLPLEDGSADVVLYVASFHHFPAREMPRALEECRRVLKPGGVAIFIEPVAQKGSYYEIVRLNEDEAEVQSEAYRALNAADGAGLCMRAERLYFLERSFADYGRLLELFVEDGTRRAEILAAAKEVTERKCRETGTAFDFYLYRSVCRLNVMERCSPGAPP